MENETREVPFYLKMEDMTMEEVINLKKALDNNKKVMDVNFQAHIVMYMQVPYSIEDFGDHFFNDMENFGVDPYKGDWFVWKLHLLI